VRQQSFEYQVSYIINNLTIYIYATETCTPLSEISFSSTGCFGVLAISTEIDCRAGIGHNSGVCESATVTADLLDGVDNTKPGLVLGRVDDMDLTTSVF
jgi:hypothetical protein